MSEPALKLVETNEVETKALSIVNQAKAVKVVDSESYIVAGDMWKALGDMIAEIKSTFDPICDAAHKAHKAATAKRASYLDPLTEAQRSVKKLMSDFDAEQERIRLAEQRRLEEEARKAEEERKIQDALLAEEAAKAGGATNEEAEQEAAAILEEPVIVAPVVVAKVTPKLTGGPVYREVWSAKIIDIRALCRAVAEGKASTECVMGNMPTLNKMATALKNTMNIPGVVAESRRV